MNYLNLTAALEYELMLSCNDNYRFRLAHTLTKLSNELDNDDYLDLLEYILGDYDDLDHDLLPFSNLIESYLE